MDAERIRHLVTVLAAAHSSAAEAAWSDLRPLGADVVPHLEAAYSTTRRWQGRVALVFHAIRFARISESAVRLGLRALQDRSYMVRYRACGLLAYTLRKDVLPALRPLARHDDPRTAEDAAAAIDAIERQNHHLFVDRDHSGRVRWSVNPDD